MTQVKQHRTSRLLVFLIIAIFGMIAILTYLHVIDKREARALFGRELQLFDASIGKETRTLLNKSLRRLYVLAETPHEWMRLIKRAHTLGQVYDDYAVYLESARLAHEKTPKNRQILIVYVHALVENGQYEEVMHPDIHKALPDSFSGLVTQAYASLAVDARMLPTSDFPYSRLLFSQDLSAMTEASDDISDPGLLLDIALSRAVDGDIPGAADEFPSSLARRFPGAYLALCYDAKNYDMVIQFVDRLSAENHVLPPEIMHIYYDAHYKSGNEKNAINGYRMLMNEYEDWRPALNLALADNNPSVLDRLKTFYNRVPQVSRFLGDYYYSRGMTTESAIYYRTFLGSCPEAVDARIRLAEIDSGYMSPGNIRDIAWEIYYSNDPAIDYQARENAALYLLWYAMSIHDRGVFDYFDGLENLSGVPVLMLALWDRQNGDPSRLLERLKTYRGILQWYAFYLKGDACLVLGRYNEAFAHLSDALSSPDTDRAFVYLKRAETQYRAGEYRAALNDLDAVKNENPAIPEAILLEKHILENL